MSDWFLEKTPINLLACFFLLIIAWPLKTLKNALIVFVFFAAGVLVEWLGVHYGFPFGEYYYGNSFGVKLDDTPLLIGVNWSMLVLITGGISFQFAESKFLRVLTGASLMVFLDLFIEPNADQLDFWYWKGGYIPFTNYVGWFATAALLHWLFQETIKKLNFLFSVNLYIAQLTFFISLYVRSFF